MASAQLSLEKQQKVKVFLEKKFIYLWFSLLASGFSVSFFMFITNWYVVDYLKLDAMLGAVFFATSVPRLLFMLIGGAIADRVNKAWVMFISDVAKGFLLIGSIGLLFFDLLTIWPLVALSFLFGVLDAFFWPASSAILPMIVEKDNVMRANSILDMTKQASLIVGPVLAAIFLGLGGYEFIFAFTALLLFVAGICDVFIKIQMDKEQCDEHLPSMKKGNITESLKEGFSYVKRTPFLLSLMISIVFLNMFFGGPFMIGLPLFTKQVLQGSEFTYSMLTGSLAAGMLVGTFVIGIINLQKKRGLTSVLGMFSLAIMFLILSISSNFWICISAVYLMGSASAVANVPLISVIQNNVDNEYMGRVLSFVTFASMGLHPVSYLMTSFFIGMQIPVQTIMTVSAVMLCIVTSLIVLKAKELRVVN